MLSKWLEISKNLVAVMFQKVHRIHDDETVFVLVVFFQRVISEISKNYWSLSVFLVVLTLNPT